MGGHLRVVESCSDGVVWGLGYDNTAWVYTGGYGGGMFKGKFILIWNVVYLNTCGKYVLFKGIILNREVPNRHLLWTNFCLIYSC